MVKSIFAMCNPLLDIIVDGDEELLKKYNMKPADAILADKTQLPLYDELSTFQDIKYVPGGSSLNVVRVANWILRTQPDGTGKCAYTGCIGNDKHGQTLVETASHDGVKMLMQIDPTTPTGTCACIVIGKERSLCANLAACQNFKEHHLEESDVQQAISSADIYYSSGFFLTVCQPAMLKVAKTAASKGAIFSMNLSAPFILEFYTKPFLEVLEHTDLVFGNETEALKYASVRGYETTDIKEVAAKLQQEKHAHGRKRIVVITQGSQPTVVATHEGVSTFDVPPVPATEIVDTNGAGDAFVGGYLAQLAQGNTIEKCVHVGNLAAGEIIKQSGCQFNDLPSFKSQL
jgi:adenosine kinase